MWKLSAPLAALAIMTAGAFGTLGCELIASVDPDLLDQPTTAGVTTGGGQGQGGQGGAGQGGGGQGGGGQGGGGECSTPETCPGTDTACQTRTCEAGVCGFDFEPAGTSIAMQDPGDCKTNVCDGAGAVTTENTDGDVLDDMNECTEDTCNGGTPMNTDVAAGTGCTVGGTKCDGAGACVECLTGADCMSGVCQGNGCAAPECVDAVKNANETDVDCGGPDCGPCADGLACAAASDCTSAVCTGMVCQAPLCDDTVENGLETDVDCGGGVCGPCATDLGCAVDADCIGGSCSGTVCLPTCTDTLQNANETDVDCGGPACNACPDGDSCGVNADCTSGVCNGGVCQVPACDDTVENGTETDVDCGGMCPLDCADGLGCAVGGDCASGVCVMSVCQPPACDDLTKNAGETDVDCGGDTCPDCADGLACLAASDCASGVCTGNVCIAAACGDQVIQGMEGCDDGGVAGGDGCSATCTVEPGYGCTGQPSVCTTTCGDGIPAGMEACDDMNTAAGDGCSATCTVQMGFTCAGAPSVCTPICGDNLVVGPEGCDDGNTTNGDCCSSTCAIESGCESEPNNTAATADGPGMPPFGMKAKIQPIADTDFFSLTVPAVADVRIETFSGGVPGACASADTVIDLIAPDGTTVLQNDDDGGISTCSLIDPAVHAGAQQLPPGTYYVKVIEFGNNATIALYNVQVTFTSLCGNAMVEGTEECDGGVLCNPDCTRVPTCGDGFVDAPETCDDGNVMPGDGCSATCTVEAGFACGGGQCAPLCGDSTTIPPETCDDGNAVAGDGCDPGCQTESAPTAEVEPNNTSADADARALDATPILVSGTSTTISGAITPVADLDRFKMTLAADSVVRFETFDATGADCIGMTTTLRVFNAASVQVATDATTGIGSCSALVLRLAAGTYYVQVEETGNNATIAAYRLQVRVQADKGSESEPNGSIATADALLGSDVFVFGGHQVNADGDVFAISVPAGKSIRAETIEGGAETCESNGIDTRIRLLDSAGVELVEDSDAGRGFCSLIDGSGTTPLDAGAKNLAAGTYYLRVEAHDPAGTTAAGQFDYRLVVTIR